MKTHRHIKLVVVAIMSATLCLIFHACGLIYIDGVIGGYTKDDLLENPDFRWTRDSSLSCDIYYEANSWAARNIAAIKRDADSSLVRILGMLHERSFPHRLSYFIVINRSRMQSLIDRQTNGIAFAREKIICAIANDSMRALGPHEMFHVVAMNLWSSTEDWVNEGMAVYADNSWWMQELHPLANYLRQQGKFLSLDELTQRFRQHDPLITYPEVGSFLKYLYETHGRDNVKTLWQHGLSTFCDSVRVDKSDLERQWLSVITARDTKDVHYKVPH
jgi:hypothetical protein